MKQGTIILMTSIISSVQSFNILDLAFDSELESQRPTFQFPESFEFGVSSNDPGLNITEIIYYDQKQKKMRLQTYYSILGLEPTKAVDLVIDEKNNRVAIQSETDCKKTQFHESLMPITLFFSMFNSLTDYYGKDPTNNHIFKLKQFDENETSPKFFFYFDDNNTFKYAKLVHPGYGDFDFYSTTPLVGKTFIKGDWYTAHCTQIDKNILAEGNGFVGFMWTLAQHLIGTEEQIMEYLGYKDFKPFSKPDNVDDEEDFEE